MSSRAKGALKFVSPLTIGCFGDEEHSDKRHEGENALHGSRGEVAWRDCGVVVVEFAIATKRQQGREE